MSKKILNVTPVKKQSETLLNAAKEIVKRFHRYGSTNYDYNQCYNLFAKFNEVNKSIDIYEIQEPKLVIEIPFPYNLNPDGEKLTFDMGDEVKFSVCNNLLIITTVLAYEDCVFPKIVFTVPKFELVNFLFPECNEIILKDNIFYAFSDDSLSKYSNLPFLPEWEIDKDVSFKSFEMYEFANDNNFEIISQDFLK